MHSFQASAAACWQRGDGLCETDALSLAGRHMKKTSSEPDVPMAPLERARLLAEVAKQRVRIAKDELKRARKRLKEAKREARRARKHAGAARKAWKHARRAQKRTGEPERSVAAGEARVTRRRRHVAKAPAKKTPAKRPRALRPVRRPAPGARGHRHPLRCSVGKLARFVRGARRPGARLCAAPESVLRAAVQQRPRSRRPHQYRASPPQARRPRRYRGRRRRYRHDNQHLTGFASHVRTAHVGRQSPRGANRPHGPRNRCAIEFAHVRELPHGHRATA
jgi:hypothetical protein